MTTLDEKLHFIGGFFKAIRFYWCSFLRRQSKVREIDLYGWAREVEQHDPNLTPPQIAEARAWGLGARAALRVNPPFPQPPYPS